MKLLLLKILYSLYLIPGYYLDINKNWKAYPKTTAQGGKRETDQTLYL